MAKYLESQDEILVKRGEYATLRRLRIAALERAVPGMKPMPKTRVLQPAARAHGRRGVARCRLLWSVQGGNAPLETRPQCRGAHGRD
jgi:hypothetical protein